MSTGLTLAPSMYGDTDEIAALAEALAPFDGAFYVTHAREWAGNHVKAVEEAMEIGRRAGVPVQYSHMAIIDSRFYGTGEDSLAPIEKARSEGMDASYDVYPYTAAGTHLAQMVPTWLQ
ncbi:MAG: aminoacylase, partial [Dehalococcoidia bacterium]|nr:aminoacylase [Dehalococcoidia bacterium]